MNFQTTWLYRKYYDLLYILSPPFLSVLFVFLFQDQILNLENIPLWLWVFLVVMIDVSHVYSTLFRTYFHPEEFKENKRLLTLVPFIVWITGVFVYSIDGHLFWRIFAYLAVFHFIRQQYGFMKLYSGKQETLKHSLNIDSIMIYSSMLYPILYWHTHIPLQFHWFIKGDFYEHFPAFISEIAKYFYICIILIYIIKEIYILFYYKQINLNKNLVIIGTALSWYIGIVHFNNDIIFSITNILTHGIPYIALIWIYGKKEIQKNKSLDSEPLLVFNNINYNIFFKRYSFILFFSVLLLFGYLEEGLWAGWIWREHLDFFSFFGNLNQIKAKDNLTWIVPLLSVPQGTHYILDGYIWKVKKKAYWNRLFFNEKT